MKACLQWINNSVPEKIYFYNYFNRTRNVYQSIVTCLFWHSPPCSWGSLLGEGTTSLKTPVLLLHQWSYHPNCSNLMEVLLSGPSYSFQGVIFRFPDWSMISNCMILFVVSYVLMICRMVENMIYCGPESGNLMSCSVWMICGVSWWSLCLCPQCAEWDCLELLL